MINFYKGNWEKILLGSFIFLYLFFYLSSVVAITPTGGTTNEINTTTAPVDPAGSHPAQAGNVTEINIFGFSTTQSWQGYYGNVSGTIQLADGSDEVMYNWSLASPEGEIYASVNESISWGNIMCFNFTATGTYGDDSGNIGNTSLLGMNLSQLENAYSIGVDDVDGVDETFSLIGAGTHNTFYTNNLDFTEGECRNTRIYNSTGLGEDDKFEEVLLYDSDTQNVVYASILNEDALGFDDAYHDFEMLVLEDGHDIDTGVTLYYFYVELQ